MSRVPGQHFLADQSVLDELVARISPQPGQCLVEVGPGTGRLTKPLLEAGASVCAIELDAELARSLPKRMGGLAGNLEVAQGDAARWLPVPATGPWRLVGNIPYQISSPLLLGLRDRPERLRDVHLMVQNEFAERAAAHPGNRQYGRLSVVLQAVWQVSLLFTVPPEAFRPPPKVCSAAIRLLPRAARRQPACLQMFEQVVRLAFSGRRKTLRNSLVSLGPHAAGQYAALRAEQLSVDDYINLADAIRPA